MNGTGMSPWGIPHGWTFVQPRDEDIPSIERTVGAYTLTIGEDDGKWVWWLCPAGEGVSISRGDGRNMVDAIMRALDALATHVGGQ